MANVQKSTNIFEESREAIHQVPQVTVDKDIYNPEGHGDTFMHAILQNESAKTESFNLPLNDFLVACLLRVVSYFPSVTCFLSLSTSFIAVITHALYYSQQTEYTRTVSTRSILHRTVLSSVVSLTSPDNGSASHWRLELLV
ncbi:hypothetical protein T4D_11453 [Trichinella pseudospiralis]|uniref:Uncharacterized protein n=1 Tax=Trichinella pseudospiralis TaxID=6337 RepID=A0A0V1FYC6_TRIPS|nr:hypothetical protein T4D_11453 [Trichinella pseudospiralis]